MVGSPAPLCVKLLILVFSCGLMGGAWAATIEEIGNLVKGPLWDQESLPLHSKGLSGPIPPELGNLTNLGDLGLSSNDLSGPIPPELGKLTKLHYLALSSNNLSGPIPPELSKLTHLSQIYLYNNRLSGPIPPQIGNLAQLSYLEFFNNRLSGPIPPELGNLTNLRNLDLSLNNLSGPIPPELGNLAISYYITLNLSNNNLSGPIPPQLGNITHLMELILYNNSLSGPIPSQLGNLINLDSLDLSANSLSGPIPPQLGNLTIKSLDLHNNHLSGPIPPELGSNTRLTSLDLSANSLSGPIPPQLGNLNYLETLNISFTATTCESLILSRLQALTRLGLPCSPPPSFKHTNISYITLSVGTPATQDLDLSSVPDSCKFVELTGSYPDLKNIRFWGGCDRGCIVNLAGTGARLSRSTRRKVCLSRISIFLDGDIPFPVYRESPHVFTQVLNNQQGAVYDLRDPNFVDSIDLGPEGRAYTGVGFSRVQAGNLCANPEAKRVVVIVYGACSVALLLATLSIVVVGRWRRRMEGSGFVAGKTHQCYSLKGGILYLWGAVQGVVPMVDLTTDILVLIEVWGAWPMWVILASVCAPFVVGAYTVFSSWSSFGWSMLGWKDLRLKWSWPSPDLDGERSRSSEKQSLLFKALALLLLPVGLLGVVVQDLLSVAERFGFHLAHKDEIAVFKCYHEARVFVELLLESLPQVMFQTALYLLGSSRATRIYIDERIFVQSIVVSLVGLSMQYCCVLWESVYENKSLARVFKDRFASAGRPIFVRVYDDGLEDEESVVGNGEVSAL